MKTRVQLATANLARCRSLGETLASVIYVYRQLLLYRPHHLKIDSLRLISLGLPIASLKAILSRGGVGAAYYGFPQLLATLSHTHSSVPPALQTLGNRQNKSKKRELVEFSILSHACSVVFLG